MNHASCQFRDKHTVGGIVFYKHAFLVSKVFACKILSKDCHLCLFIQYVQSLAAVMKIAKFILHGIVLNVIYNVTLP